MKTPKTSYKGAKPSAKGMEFIGFDLGHGETALARAYGGTTREPEILEYRGERSFVTAVARTRDGLKIGSDAVNMAAFSTDAKAQAPDIWVKFKSRDIFQDDIAEPTRLFTGHLIKALEADKKIQGVKHSQFIIGCPSGWDDTTRTAYALMTALEQGYLSIDAARRTVLIVDIGSSTTDFTYCRDMESEDVGHNFLGSGLLDSEIFRINLARQDKREHIEALIAQRLWNIGVDWQRNNILTGQKCRLKS